MNWFSGVCLSCGIISRLFAASMQYGKILLPMFGSGVATFLSVAFVLWTLVQVAKMLLPFAPANRTNAIASTLFTKGALVLTVSIILLAPTSYDLYWRYIYKPVVNISINMSNALLAEGTKGQNGQYTVDTFTLKDGNKCSKTVISGLSEEERSLQYRLECMVHSFQNAFSYGIATGWYMITQTGANANNLLIGVIVFVVSITPPITFAVMILDALMRWVIISCLSPALIGCYCFPATRNYANTGFKGLLEAGLTLSVVSVVAVLSAGVIQEAVKTVQAGMNKAGSAVAGAASTAATAVQGAVQGTGQPSTPTNTTTTRLSSYTTQQPLTAEEQKSAVPSNLNQCLVDKAMQWSGKEYKPGQRERCADFVRHILDECNASNTGVSAQPIDNQTPTGPLMANSFFGKDIGGIITSKEALQPGDLVAFCGTYGGYRGGGITPEGKATGQISHVGIYVGNGMMVDRSTSSKPVFYRSLATFSDFCGGVRVGTDVASAGSGDGTQASTPLLTFAMAATWLLIFGPWIAKQGLVLARTTTDTLFGAFGGALGGMGAAFTPFVNAGMGVAGFLGAFAGKGALNALANNELVAKWMDALKDGAGAVGGAVGGFVGDRLQDAANLGQRVVEATMGGLDTLRQNNAIVDATLNVLAAGGNFLGDVGGRIASTTMNGLNAVGDFAKGMQDYVQQKFNDTQQFLQMLEANRIALLHNMHQAPEAFLKAVNEFLRQNEGISKTFDSIQALQKGFDDLVDKTRTELQRLQNQLATVGNNIYQALPSPVQHGLRATGDITQNVGNRVGEFVNNTKERIIDDIKNAPAYYAVAAGTAALGALTAVPLMAVKAVAGDLPVIPLVRGAEVGATLANRGAGNLSRMVDLKHAEMTNEAQRHQALSNVDKNIEDMKNTVKQELADLKKREDVLRKDTTTPAADIAKELGDIRALRQVILRSGQEEITRMMSERDDKIRNINEYHDKKQAILQTAQQDYLGHGDLKRNDIREDYNKKHEELSDRIRHNDERLQNIDQKLRENTAMLAAGLPANMTTQIAKEISKLSWEKTEVKAEILRLNEKQAELYTQEKLDVQTAIKTYDTLASRGLDRASDKIIKKEEEIAARAAKKEESKKEWNDGVREKLEKMGIK